LPPNRKNLYKYRLDQWHESGSCPLKTRNDAKARAGGIRWGKNLEFLRRSFEHPSKHHRSSFVTSREQRASNALPTGLHHAFNSTLPPQLLGGGVPKMRSPHGADAVSSRAQCRSSWLTTPLPHRHFAVVHAYECRVPQRHCLRSPDADAGTCRRVRVPAASFGPVRYIAETCGLALPRKLGMHYFRRSEPLEKVVYG
jgi:hypothetical protein